MTFIMLFGGKWREAFCIHAVTGLIVEVSRFYKFG
jgi:hypothetical protein